MIQSSIRLIAFDLDDSLWPCMPTIIKAEETLYQWLTEHYPLITNRYSFTSLMGKRLDFQKSHPHLQVDLSELRRQFLAHLAKQCHYPEHEVAENGFDVYITMRNKVNFYPDVIPALAELSKRYKLASISNGNADVFKTEAGEFMDYAINAADVQAAKPDPKMFQVIEKKSGYEPSQCLYIGDSVEMDVVGAQNANWECIWLNRDNNVWPKKFGQQVTTIPSLAGL